MAARPLLGHLRPASEAIILVMACLSPWAIGAVDAWAQLALDVAIVILAILGTVTGLWSDWKRRLFCGPSLALGTLALLALLQAVPMPVGLLKTIAPTTYEFRAGLVHNSPARVKTDLGPPVAPPLATLSQDPDASLRTAAQLAGAWILFQAVLGLGRGSGPFRRFGLMTVWNGVALSVFAIAQGLSWSGKIYGIRKVAGEDWRLIGGPFVSHNHLAAYLNIAFGFATGFLLATIQEKSGQEAWTSRRSSRTMGKSAWSFYAFGVIVTGLLASHSRGGCLAAVIAAVVTLVFLRPETIRLRASLAATLALVLLFVIATGTSSSFQRLASIPGVSQTGFNGRMQVWGVALRAWVAYPIWGTGLGSFPAASAPFYSSEFGGGYFSHAESEYLHMLTEGGAIGLGLALLALTAIARLGRLAQRAASSDRDRALVMGALLSGLALMIQCFGDFPLHIPAVGVSAVILFAHLSRLGLEARDRSAESRPAYVVPAIVGLATVGLGFLLVLHTYRLARAEAVVSGAGLPRPGVLMPTDQIGVFPKADLERMRPALETALRFRPNWAEGHIRLGQTLLGLYTHDTAKALEGNKLDAPTLARLSDPLWFHFTIHSATPAQVAEIGDIMEEESVRRYLVPAARSFLHARRCSPDIALSHARLGSLDYVLDQGESASVHAARALRLNGYDYRVIDLAGIVAADVQDGDLAARCWRKSLQVHPKGWSNIAFYAGPLLTPEQIVKQVLRAQARFAVPFADLLYSAPDKKDRFDEMLRTAIPLLTEDATLSPTDRLWVEGQARARLGERDQARKLMAEALELEPLKDAWRTEYVAWLIDWNDPKEAQEQARIGVHLNPADENLQKMMKLAAEAFARGTEAKSEADRPGTADSLFP